MANLLPHAVLKIFAFQDGHENKDAYDLVFTLLNHKGGLRVAGQAAPVAKHPQVSEALILLGERLSDAGQDGPNVRVVFGRT